MLKDSEFTALQGETITSITGCEPGSDAVYFETVSGRRFQMYHDQDCCECVEVEDVIGDIADLIGEPVLLAEEVSHENDNPEGVPEKDYQDSFTWTFYKLATNKGFATIRWYGESNGYYSETVSFYEQADQ